MKKAISILIGLLFALTLLYPCGFFIAHCFGYTFALFSVPAFSTGTAVLSAGLIVLMFVVREAPDSPSALILSAVITPFSLVNAGLSIFDDPDVLVIVCALFSAVCCFCLTIRCGRPFALKTVSLVLSFILILPLCFFIFISLIFGGISQNTVVRTLYSPNENYCAQVIDSDQGALGGNTFVEVHEHGFNAVLFRIEKQPRRVYSGSWSEYLNMDIEWLNNEVLIINSVEYPMS